MSAPLVLLHGWGLTPQVWNPLHAHLPPELAVYAPALPGHGEAAPAAGPELAAWSDALLPQLPDKCVLCGWSLGALLALDLARRYPERISRLVLIGASPCFVSQPDWPHGLDASTVGGFTRDFETAPDATLRRFIALQSLGDARRRAVLGGLNEALASPGEAQHGALGNGLRLLADVDLRETIRGLRQPALVLHGAADALMPISAARWLAERLPGSHLAVFDDCGHAPFLSRPLESAALIGTFARV